MALMFQATTNIKKAVSLINGIDPGKFPLLLSRILQKLHIKDERTFSEEEEEKLEGVLQLQHTELELVVEACEFFLHQAAYHSAKPTVLGEQLKQLELEDEKVKAIVDTWSSGGKSVIAKLRQRTFAPKQLEDVKWRLNLEMGSSSCAKSKEPNAMFELGVRDDSTQEKEKIRIELSHEELYKFYNQLETIQGQLDSLS